jgi:transposase-like protein
MTTIQHAVRLYHRFPLSYRDVQELLHQRGIQVSHEMLREWCITVVFAEMEALEQRGKAVMLAGTAVMHHNSILISPTESG